MTYSTSTISKNAFQTYNVIVIIELLLCAVAKHEHAIKSIFISAVTGSWTNSFDQIDLQEHDTAHKKRLSHLGEILFNHHKETG